MPATGMPLANCPHVGCRAGCLMITNFASVPHLRNFCGSRKTSLKHCEKSVHGRYVHSPAFSLLLVGVSTALRSSDLPADGHSCVTTQQESYFFHALMSRAQIEVLNSNLVGLRNQVCMSPLEASYQI